jgi:hypothetical protein
MVTLFSDTSAFNDLVCKHPVVGAAATARAEEAATARGAAATARAEEAATARGAAATGAGHFFGVSKYGGRWIGVVHVHTLERALLPHHLQQKDQLRTLSFATPVEAARAVDRCAA